MFLFNFFENWHPPPTPTIYLPFTAMQCTMQLKVFQIEEMALYVKIVLMQNLILLAIIK